jgi:hypothetical protein
LLENLLGAHRLARKLARKRQKIIESETPEEKVIRLERERKARIKQQKKAEKDEAGKSIRIRV